MPIQPIFLATARLQKQSGLIVTMSDSGDLQVSFLGTDQMSQTDLGKLHQSEKEIDYEKMEQKYRAICEQIKSSETETNKMPSDNLNVNLQISPVIEECNEYLEDP